MGFLSPWWLAGLLAIGLPVWLHLLQQHKLETLKFPSLQFFEKRQQSSVKHRRLKYRLLFALRTLLLLLLAILFAQPYLRRDAAALPTSGHRLILVDNSFSMQTSGALDRAKQQALTTVDSLGSGETAQILSLGSSVSILTQPAKDKAELRSAIQSIVPGGGRSAFAEVGRTTRTISQAMKVPVTVEFFSDFQRSSMPTSFNELALPEGSRLIVHNVRPDPAPNFAVQSVSAPSVIADPKSVRLGATLAGFGTPAATRTASLVVNGKVVQSKPVAIPANGKASLEFTGLDAPYGWNRCEVRLDASDALPADDAFRFAVERSDPRPVLFLHEAGRARVALYFRSALEASAGNFFTVEPVQVNQAGGANLAKYAFVVLSDVSSIPASLNESLKSYVSGGGGVLAALGASAATLGTVPLTGQKITDSRYASRGGERFFAPAAMDQSHPSIRQANKWEGVRFFQVIRIDPGSAKIAARIDDETPLLTDQRIGNGRVLTFASSFDNVANDFPLHSSFLPFVDQTSRYLAQVETRPATVLVDSSIELRAEGAKAAAVDVIDPKGQRALDLRSSSTAQAIRAELEGFYEIARQNNRRELVAVNADRAESDLAAMPKESVAIWAATGGSGNGTSGEASLPDQRNVGLWWYVALLLLIALLAESFVASRYLEPETT